MNTHRGPTKMSVDELRQRVWSMLAAKKHSGPMPSVDSKVQSIFLLLTAAYSVKEIGAGLGISENFVRVQKRRIAQSIGIAPVRTDAKKYDKADAAARKRAIKVPDHDIGTLFMLVQRLGTEMDDWMVEVGDAAEAHKMGRLDLVERIRARADAASS
jgi:hypothetical protein